MSESAKSEISTVEWEAVTGHSVFFVLATSQKNAKDILKGKGTGDDFTWKPMYVDGAIGVAVPTSTASASTAGTAGTAPSGPSSITKGGGTKLNGLPVVLQTIGVLGKIPDNKGKNDIPKNHIVVDPAGLSYVNGTFSIKTDANGNGGAGGLSGPIYAHYHILNEGNLKGVALNQCERFPELVTANIKNVGDALACRYYEGTVIHVVGPDFRNSTITLDNAVPKLRDAYYKVIRAAEEHVHISNNNNEHNEYKSGAVVRLSLVSMGVFAGPFYGNPKEKAELTARAVIDAFAKYKSEDSQTKPAAPEVPTVYWMCLYQSDDNQPDYKAYESAFQKYIETMKSSLLMV